MIQELRSLLFILFRANIWMLLPNREPVHIVTSITPVDDCPGLARVSQGGMERWDFKGLRASHGVSVSHRSIGSTGGHQVNFLRFRA